MPIELGPQEGVLRRDSSAPGRRVVG